MTTALWSVASSAAWRRSLDRYTDVVAAQGVERLPALDQWYHEELPALITDRAAPHVLHDELVRVTEWKMARGVWRAPNLVLVRGNTAALVVNASTAALRAIPHPTAPISALAELAGVGPATASAVAAAAAPRVYPFFDELVAAQIPALGAVKWTLGYYGRYAQALRERAHALGDGWTPAMCERALWSLVGGKRGAVD